MKNFYQNEQSLTHCSSTQTLPSNIIVLPKHTLCTQARYKNMDLPIWWNALPRLYMDSWHSPLSFKYVCRNPAAYVGKKNYSETSERQPSSGKRFWPLSFKSPLCMAISFGCCRESGCSLEPLYCTITTGDIKSLVNSGHAQFKTPESACEHAQKFAARDTVWQFVQQIWFKIAHYTCTGFELLDKFTLWRARGWKILPYILSKHLTNPSFSFKPWKPVLW